MEFHEYLQEAMTERGWEVPELRVALRAVGLDMSESNLKRIVAGKGRAFYALIVACGKVFGGVERFFDESCRAAAV